MARAFDDLFSELASPLLDEHLGEQVIYGASTVGAIVARKPANSSKQEDGDGTIQCCEVKILHDDLAIDPEKGDIFIVDGDTYTVSGFYRGSARWIISGEQYKRTDLHREGSRFERGGQAWR